MKKNNLALLQALVHLLTIAAPVAAKANPEEKRAAAEKRFLENYQASLTGGPQTLENRLAIRAYQSAQALCSGYKCPVSKLEEELQGKLFFVQTLPGLSVDGSLIATYQPKGVHIGEPSPNYRNDYISSTGEKVRGEYTVASDWKSTNHFTINHLAPSAHYGGSGNIDRPFVAIVPVNQDILQTTVSASFPEVVTVGDYTLPPGSIILVRSDKKDKIPAYYREKGFKILEYDGVDAESDLEPIDFSRVKFDPSTGSILDASTGQPLVRKVIQKKKDDYAKKRDAIKAIIADHGGLTVDMTGPESKRPWTYRPVTDRQGRNINTLEVFEKLFPNRTVAFGDDEFTHWSSEGEQWRMFRTRSGHRDLQFYGEIGFSIEQYHSERLNEWLDSLDLPPAVLAHHKKVEKDSLISYRAMDYIFDHFKKRELAFQYIEKHLLPLEKNRTFEAVRNNPNFNKKSIDELAKVFCDYDFLVQQKPSEKFDLATQEDIVESLNGSSSQMKPDEARGFFRDFFTKSSIVKNFSSEEQVRMREAAIFSYLSILSHLFQGGLGPVPSSAKKELKDYKIIIQSMFTKLSDFGKRGAEERQALGALKAQYRALLEL